MVKNLVIILELENMKDLYFIKFLRNQTDLKVYSI